jgi:hypothetical protein
VTRTWALCALACACSSSGVSAGDAGASDAEISEAAISDAASDAALACTPGDVGGFTPVWRPPSGAHQSACTSRQISDYYDACLAPSATKATCARFGGDASAADHACAACLVTKAASAALGPVVLWTSSVEIDFAGCLALVDPASDACAEAYQADVECTHAACDGACPPVTDAASAQTYASSLEAANTAACAPYAAAARCAFDAADGGDAAKCLFAGTTFAELYAAIAPLFCGP